MQLNILVNDLSASQLSFTLTNEINKLGEDLETSHIDCIVYYENLAALSMAANFAIMQMAEAWAQQQPIIATSLSTANKLQGFPACKKKFFYVWDLEWLRGQRRVYDQVAHIYLDKSLQLIARSEEHASLIKNCFNREVVGIVENFNMKEFINVVGK